MEVVRIGNDICLQVHLRELTDFDQHNIKQLRAYLINVESQNPNPICVDACRCNCGPRGYHFYPWSCCRRPYITVNPVAGPAPLPCGYRCYTGCVGCHGWDRFGCNHHCGHIDSYFIPDSAVDRFLAPSKVLSEKNEIEVYFPAKDQLECGTYKLVVVIAAFEHGWGRSDVHTYTIDYGDVFTLVNDSDGASGYVKIDVSKQSSVTPDGSPIHTDITDATTQKAGIVRLAESINDADGSDVVTMNVLNQYGLGASVDNTTLVFGKASQEDSETNIRPGVWDNTEG